jgi:hypothetical protein
VWSANIRSSTDGRKEVLVMQSAKNRPGSDGVRFFSAMARSGFVVAVIRRGRIRNTGPEGHVRAPEIVVWDQLLRRRGQGVSVWTYPTRIGCFQHPLVLVVDGVLDPRDSGERRGLTTGGPVVDS